MLLLESMLILILLSVVFWQRYQGTLKRLVENLTRQAQMTLELVPSDSGRLPGLPNSCG